MPYAEIGDVVNIPNLGQRVRVRGHYDYEKAPTYCPICEEDGAGFVWHGYFSCDYGCPVVALVETGECFMPLNWKPETSQDRWTTHVQQKAKG